MHHHHRHHNISNNNNNNNNNNNDNNNNNNNNNNIQTHQHTHTHTHTNVEVTENVLNSPQLAQNIQVKIKFYSVNLSLCSFGFIRITCLTDLLARAINANLLYKIT